MKILHKYVLKEHLSPLIFALAALTSVLLLNYVSRHFGELVGKGLPWTVIAEFFALSVPFTIALTFPMAVLVATLYAFSRLAAENEITALKASGVSMPSILAPVLIAAAGITVLMLFFNDQILPRTNHTLAALLSDISQTKPTFALREQVINEISQGKLYLRANHLEEGSNRMREITIYDMADATRRRTIYADSGTLVMAQNRRDLLMTLHHGYMQDVPTAKPLELQRLFFNTDFIQVKGVANQFQKSGSGVSKGNREMSVCEMQHEVEQSEHDYLETRKSFLRNLAIAKAHGLTLDPQVAKTKIPVPPRFTLGGSYCAMLHALGVRALGAQTVNQGVQQKPPPAPTPISPVVGKITATPVTTPAKTPATTITATPTVTPTPSPTPVVITPSIIESDRSRIADQKVTIALYEVEIHKKFAISVACFIFVMLGAPIAIRFPRGGVGLTIGVSLFVFALYYVGLIAGASLATHGYVPAALSMWAANIIFGMVALLLLKRMGTEGGSSRGGDAGELIEGIRRWTLKQIYAAGLLPDRRTTKRVEAA